MSGAVQAQINYILPTDEKPVTYLTNPGSKPAQRNAEYQEVEVTIRDARPTANALDLEREGFTFNTGKSAVSDFYDSDEIEAVYSPEVERLVKQASGAAEVLVFDHTIRVADDDLRTERKLREPVHVAHNDYTPRSAPQRVRDLLPADRAEALLEHRFAVVQMWRPIAGPVQDMPLAICDAQSIDERDFVLTDLVYTHRVGEVMQLSHNPGHRWFYFPDMEPGEALIFKTYESLADGRARFTAHTAFADPNAPADARPRQSIESRTLAFFAP